MTWYGLPEMLYGGKCDVTLAARVAVVREAHHASHPAPGLVAHPLPAPLQSIGGQPYVYRDPAQAPIDPPYKAAVALKKQNLLAHEESLS